MQTAMANTDTTMPIRHAYRSRWPDLGLRVKVTLGAILPLTIVLGLFTVIQYQWRRAMLLDNLTNFAAFSAQVVEANMTHMMQEADFSGVQTVLESLQSREEISVLYILNADGEVVFAPSEADVGTVLDNSGEACQECHRLPAAERPGSVIVTDENGQRVFRSMMPFENGPECVRCHGDDDRLIGMLLSDVSVASFEAPLAADLREYLLWWMITMLATIFVVNVVLSRIVLRPLHALTHAVVDFGRGELPALRLGGQGDEIGRLASAFNAMAWKINQRRQENQALSGRLQAQNIQRGALLRSLITAQEDERRRVARELHDGLGQTLVGLGLQVKVLRRYLSDDTERAEDQLAAIQALIQDTSNQMYDIILDLRPSALDDLGLVPALRSLAERSLRPAGLEFELLAEGLDERLPAEMETTLFRVIQEALNNSVRHSGASKIQVRLICANGIVSGTVQDDGTGFDPESIRSNGHNGRGLGLLGMRERVQYCGGQLDIRARPGRGTQVCIELPLLEAYCE